VIAVRSFADRQVAVFGLARSGLASVRSLKAGGAEVFAWDEKDALREAAKAEGAVVSPWRDWPWDKIAALVLSPGVPFTHPRPHDIVVKAKEAGVAVVGDIELLAREIGSEAGNHAPLITVTGTNGKSTTTALIGHILAAAGFDAQVGGNIGKPALELSPPRPKTIYVLEISSYQIDLSPGLKPDVTILTNITPDHIDRHGSMENYVAVKTRLLKQTLKSGLNVVGVDDAHGAAIFTKLTPNGGPPCVPVSVGKVLGRGVFVLDGTLYDAQSERAAKIVDLTTAEHLPGAHNWQNAALAYAATKPFAKDARVIASAIVDFPGLAHRIEEVGRIGKVRFVNDSKATNADAAERALVCFSDIFWIAGGKPKQGGIAPLAPHFSRIRKAYLIGEAANEFKATLEGKVAVEISGTLENALASAAADAARSQAVAPVVLLSPACASFDQFRDFEQRGDAFRALVAKLSAQPVREAS
jgi:UDP-N-acetylmuramoylalanine--D-glutamate ligase